MRLRGLAILVAALALAPAAGAETVLVAEGRGWGHGIEMSQWGARGMADRGRPYQGILAHYYPGTRLGPAPMSRVRVLLAAGKKKLRVGSKRTFIAVDARGRRVRIRAGTLKLGPRLVVRGRRLASPVRFRPGGWALRLGGVPYRGEIVVRSRGGRMSAVNELGLERYLRGVVPYEMPSDWPTAALRAQAVVARSYALATLKPGKIYDLHSDQRSQVYGGIRAETPQTSAAIGRTAGRVLLWRGSVATTFYHSTSGGRTAPVWEVWPDALRVPYLRGVRDVFDHGPHHTWGPVVLRGKKLIRRAREIEVVRGRSGRVTAVVLDGRRIPGSDFRRELDLRSTWFRLAVLRLDSPRARELRGLARGVRGAVVQRLDRGRWRRVARVDGSFRLRVRKGGRYRLAAIGIRGPAVRVRAPVAAR
jgi:stage II sporulation protein D